MADPTCDMDLPNNTMTGGCMGCLQSAEDAMMQCMAPAAPAAASFCPAGNPLDSAATIRDFGECVHACMAPDAWQLSHACFPMVSSGTFDYNNNTCGIGNCDTHTTEAACTAGDGHWQADDMSGSNCGDAQGMLNYYAYLDENMAMMMSSIFMARIGEDCCAGFTLAGHAVCSYADQETFMAIESSALEADRQALMSALDPGCLACLMDTDGDFAACIALNPNPGNNTLPFGMWRGAAGECTESCPAAPTSCAEFVAYILPDGCASTCTSVFSASDMQAMVDQFCPAVSADEAECTSGCMPGTAPYGNVTGGACTICEHNTFSTFGTECQPCAAPNIVDPQRLSCSACPAGTGPSSDYSQCLPCTGMNYSQIGICQPCDAPSIVNPERTACTRCLPGESPNADMTLCEACVGATFSSMGEACTECSLRSADYVVDAQHTSCTPCQAGTGPDNSHQNCQDCTGSQYSPSGVCIECDPLIGVPMDGGRVCSSTTCLAGTTCPAASCATTADCVACAVGRVSLGGSCSECLDAGKVANLAQSACEPCPAGTTPSALRSECTPCAANMFSMFGTDCADCAAPNVVDPQRLSCTVCVAGEGPTAGSAEVDRICAACAGNFYSPGGECIDCPAPNVVSADHRSCNRCDGGSAPNADRTACEPCAPGTYSPFGASCAVCAAPNIIDPQRLSCSACPAGTGPSSDYSQCLPCTGTNYSQIGICQPCDAPSIVNPERTACTRCLPGESPNADRTLCEACVGLSYSPLGGECLPCADPYVVDPAKTSCTPCTAGFGPVCAASGTDSSGAVVCFEKACQTCEAQHYSSFGVCLFCDLVVVDEGRQCSSSSCLAGTTCPTTACADPSECEICTVGTVSLGGSCRPCVDDGKVANPEQSSCMSCSPGAEPNSVRSACQLCGANNYSMFGWECSQCVLPNVVDSRRSSCSTCGPGTGPVDHSQSAGPQLDLVCELCAGTSYSPAGECLDCPAPSIVSADKRQCTRCVGGQMPNADRTACVDCVTVNTTYSPSGDMCNTCEPPSVVNAMRTSCRACSPGTGPSPGYDACLPCNGTMYSQIGQCQQCDAPNVVNAEHTSCTRCLPGEAPNADRTQCLPCVGLSYSPLGGECLPCNGTLADGRKDPYRTDAARTSCTPCLAGDGPARVESDSVTNLPTRYGCAPCEAGQYSSIGVCQICQDGYVVVAQRTACQQSSCNAGTECPTEECASTDECVPCSTGNVSLGGSCTPCVALGKVANPSQSSCESCTGGQEPSQDRSACAGCGNNTYSMFGFEVSCHSVSTVPIAYFLPCRPFADGAPLRL